MKRAIGIIILGLLWCNVSFGEVLPRHNVSLFGIVLGDTIDNYKIYTRHYSDPMCKNVKVVYYNAHCYRLNLKMYKMFFSYLEPPIQNDEYDRYDIRALFYSKKINIITARSKKRWKDNEIPLCERRASKIREIIATKYEKEGWQRTKLKGYEVMKKGTSSFSISANCFESLTVRMRIMTRALSKRIKIYI